jgi:hypothetical protein
MYFLLLLVRALSGCALMGLAWLGCSVILYISDHKLLHSYKLALLPAEDAALLLQISFGAALCLLGFAYSMSVGSITWVYGTEIFPYRARTKAVSLGCVVYFLSILYSSHEYSGILAEEKAMALFPVYIQSRPPTAIPTRAPTRQPSARPSFASAAPTAAGTGPPTEQSTAASTGAPTAESTTADATPGDATSGDATAGDATSGDGDATGGDATGGDATSGDSDAPAGDATSGDATAGDAAGGAVTGSGAAGGDADVTKSGATDPLSGSEDAILSDSPPPDSTTTAADVVDRGATATTMGSDIDLSLPEQQVSRGLTSEASIAPKSAAATAVEEQYAWNAADMIAQANKNSWLSPYIVIARTQWAATFSKVAYSFMTTASSAVFSEFDTLSRGSLVVVGSAEAVSGRSRILFQNNSFHRSSGGGGDGGAGSGGGGFVYGSSSKQSGSVSSSSSSSSKRHKSGSSSTYGQDTVDSPIAYDDSPDTSNPDENDTDDGFLYFREGKLLNSSYFLELASGCLLTAFVVYLFFPETKG